MRQLKITSIKVTSQQININIEKYRKQADEKRIDPQLELALLNVVRNGDRVAIVKLVNCREYIIIKVIENELKQQINTPNIPLEKLISTGRTALITLAKKELGSTSRERFFRFGAWHVRQAIIKELDRGNIN